MIKSVAMDFVKDQNPKPIYLADSLTGLPDYVKVANQIMPEDLAELSDAAFGVPGTREFPVHTKEAAWLSAAYAMGSGQWEADLHLENTIRKSAKLFGIEDDLQKLEDAFAAQNKQASAPASRFALTVDFGDTANLGLQSFYEINDPYQISKSARAMHVDFVADRLRIELFRPAAVELVKAAREFNMDLEDIHPAVRCFGEERLPDFENALQVAELRKNAGVPDEAIQLYKDAALGAQQEPDQIPRWLDLWLDLDSSFAVKYSSYQPDPYSAFYAGESEDNIAKAASEMVIIADVMIPSTVLSLVPEDNIRKHFRKEAADLMVAARGCAVADPATASTIFEKLGREVNQEFLQLLLDAA